MVGGGDQLDALLDLVGVLDRSGVPYALIGGIAVGIHSEVPRATDDVDVAVPTATDLDALAEVLVTKGFQARGRFVHSMNFRHPSGEPVQIAVDAGFDEMIERAETIDVAGTAVRIVRKDDLIETKQRAARDPARRKSKALRDQADAELLKGDVPEPDEGW